MERWKRCQIMPNQSEENTSFAFSLLTHSSQNCSWISTTMAMPWSLLLAVRCTAGCFYFDMLTLRDDWQHLSAGHFNLNQPTAHFGTHAIKIWHARPVPEQYPTLRSENGYRCFNIIKYRDDRRLLSAGHPILNS
jgi:hypothetical protein